MEEKNKKTKLTQEELSSAFNKESELFRGYFSWLEEHMPPSFFEEVETLHTMMVAHNLMGFPMQDYFSQFKLQHCAIVMCLDSPDADLQILRHYNMYGIKNYQTFISDEPPPFPGVTQKLRIGVIYFTEFHETDIHTKEVLSAEECKELFLNVSKDNPELSHEEFDHLLEGMNSRFVRSMNAERLVLALNMFIRAKNARSLPVRSALQ